MFLTREAGADLGGRGWIRENLLNKMKVIVNIMEEIMANTKERYVYRIVIFTFWHWYHYWCSSFQLDSCSQIDTFWGYVQLTLPPQDTSLPLHPTPTPPTPSLKNLISASEKE